MFNKIKLITKSFLILVLMTIFTTASAAVPGGVTGSGSGTAADPFTSMSAAYFVDDGVYYFNIDGETFSSYVDNTTNGGGWILVASGDGSQSGAYTENRNMTKRSNSVLPPAVVSKLSARKEVRIQAETGENAGLLDIVSSDTNVLERFDAYEAFGRRNDEDMTQQWTGIGVSYLSAGCNTQAGSGNATNYEFTHNIIHACDNPNGTHWLPGGQLEKVDHSQTNGTGLNLWVRSNNSFLSFWYKADSGITGSTNITNWADQSVNNLDLTQSDSNKQPGFFENAMNFNPVVKGDGEKDYLENANGAYMKTFIAVSRPMKYGKVECSSIFSTIGGDNQNIRLCNSDNEDTWYIPGNNADFTNGGGKSWLNNLSVASNPAHNGKPHILIAESENGFNYNTGYEIGTSYNSYGDRNFSGEIAEMIAYDRNLTDSERQKIDSYLALKYGITLDQTTTTDYLNSYGEKIWDANLDSTYNKDIFGIGRDNFSSLNQEISKSVNDGTILTISTDNNFTGANGTHNSLNDGQFLVIGNNGGATTNQLSEMPQEFQWRLEREWFVQNTGSVGEVNLKFDGNFNGYVILLDDDGDFSNGARIGGWLNSNNEVSLALPDKTYFTIAKPLVLIEFDADTSGSEETKNSPKILVKGKVLNDIQLDVADQATGSATAGSDYNFSSPQTLTIPAGDYDGTLATAVDIPNLTITDDSLTENNETIDFELTSIPVGVSVKDINNDGVEKRTSTYTIQDNDKAKLIIDDVSGMENGGDITISVRLDKAVPGSFSVDAKSNDGTATLSNSDYNQVEQTLNFNGNAGEVQTFVLTPINDPAVEPDETLTISLSNLNPSNLNVDISDIGTITIQNDDQYKLSIVKDSDGAERWADSSFTINLSPTNHTGSAITGNISYSGTAENGVDFNGPTTFSIPDGSNSVGINLSIIDDDIDEDDETMKLTISNPSVGIITENNSATAIITDNDTSGISVSQISSNTTEIGGTSDFTMVLTSKPSDKVVINLSSDDTSEGTISPASITFTPENWNSPQKVFVTGVDDGIVDGNISYNIITEAAVSNDPKYNGINPDDVAVVNIDNDSYTINITKNSDGAEGGANPSFTINVSPANNTGSAISGDIAYSGTATSGTDFNGPATFSIPNGSSSTIINLEVVNDDLVESNETINLAISNVNNGATIGTGTANAILADNDPPTITINDNAENIVVNIPENAGTDTFKVELGSQPATDVVLNITSQNSAEAVVDKATLTFTNENWNIPQLVKITGVDDNFDRDDSTSIIVSVDDANSDDAFDPLDDKIINVNIIDDDQSGFNISPISSDTSEDGGSASFTISLKSKPSADVSFNLSSSDEGEGVVSPTSITFTPENWNSPQTITITGVDDDLVDGTIAYNIILAAANSGDENYNGLKPNDVVVKNLNNDTYSSLVLTQIGNEADDPDNVPSVVTIEQLKLIEPGLENIKPEHEEAYQKYIDENPDKISSPATQEEVQKIIDEVNKKLSRKGSSGRKSASAEFTCKDTRALNFKNYGIHKESLCEYPQKMQENNPAKSLSTKNGEKSQAQKLGFGEKCAASQILTQNLKAGDRDGKYSSWQKEKISEVKILQAHMNRLGFKSGPVDGILGPITDGAIKRMQKFLGTKADGLVGPKTRALINNSCK